MCVTFQRSGYAVAMDYPKLIVSNQMEESTSIQGVKVSKYLG